MLTWQQLAELFAQMELELIASLKRNLTRHKDWEKREGFDWPAWQALKLRAIGRYKQENRQIIQQYMEVIGPETEEMLQAQFAEGRDETAAGYEDQTGHTPISDGAFFGVNAKRMNALLADTQQLEEKASSAALRMMDDVYRQTLHRAEIAMAAGTVTLPKAIDMAVEDFLRVGINCIEYKNGRRVNIADYAEMALRTAATRSKLQGDAAMRARLGVDTVRVSQYGMCSDTCLPWQGRVYIDDVFGVWNGERAGKRGQSVNGNWYPLLSEAVENGLFHPNCRHTLTTWYEGISTMSEPMDPENIRENAALEQEQRRLERAVRQAKRLEMGSTDTESIRKYSLQRRIAQKKLKAFVDQHSDVLRRAPWKEKVYEGQSAYGQIVETFKMNREYISKVEIESDNPDAPKEYKTEFDLEQVQADYREFLTTVPEPYKMYLEQSLDTVTYQRLDDKRVLFGYIERLDSVLYNPTHPDFDDGTFSIINTHELAHRIDAQFMIDAAHDQQFNVAIANAKKNLVEKYVEHLECCKNTDEDGFMSDVMSAIADGQLRFPYYHSPNYWGKEGTKGEDCFANIFSLHVFRDTEKINYLKTHFPEIMDAFDELMKSLEI